MKWLISTGVLAILGCGFAFLWHDRMRTRGPHPMTAAYNNARQIGLALFEFESEYGRYPDASTAAPVLAKSGRAFSLSDRTSNDVFAQMLVARIALSERMFYAEAKSAHRPDDVFSSDATILEHGECAFAFISGLSPAGDPMIPLAFGPVIPGTATFDKKSCEGRAIILRVDNSVTSLPIDASGKVIDHGMDFFDPRQPYWHGKAPDVKWPR